jgi:hypothetical protein
VTNGKERKFHPIKEHGVGINSRKKKAEKKSRKGPFPRCLGDEYLQTIIMVRP